jgi:hypothetical protein
MGGIFGGGRTPDDFPGERIDESIQLLLVSASLPSTDGEIYYVSGSVSGSGFFFHEEGVIRRLGLDEPTHEALNSLAHDNAANGYEELQYNTIGLTNLTIWTDIAKTQKLQDYTVVYGPNYRFINAMTSSAYNPDGSLKAQVIEVPTYDSRRRIITVTRTRVL